MNIIDKKIFEEVRNIAKGTIRFNEPMREHTTIKVGGPADIWFEPNDIDDLLNVVSWAKEKEIGWLVLGNGSNLLIRDKGIRGVVISLRKFDWINENEGVVNVGSGAMLPTLLNWTVEKGLSGLEGVTGIPGTVGGAVSMNAGTKDETISKTLVGVKWFDRGRVSYAEKEDLVFEYRKLKMSKNTIILEASFKFIPSDKQEIEKKIDVLRKHRKETQPLLWPSMGSVFKNPKGTSAWKLIDEVGLRSVRVGGARISNEHTNWIINEGNATAKDVEILIKMIKDRVKEESDVNLETEIIVLGE